MQKVPIPGVINGKQEPEDPVLVAAASRNVVGECRGVMEAVVDGGREGLVEVQGVRSAKAGDRREKK